MKRAFLTQEDTASVAAGAILGVGLWLLYLFGAAIVQSDSTVKAATIGGVVAIATLVITVFRERGRSFQEAHRERKIEVYSKFYDELFRLLRESKSDVKKEENLSELLDRWFEMSRGIMFYGSPEVVLTFSAFRRGSSEENVPIQVLMSRIGKILLAMRADIGLSNNGLNEMNIHQIYANEDVMRLGLPS